MPDRIADLMAWGLSEGVARRVASRDRPVGPVRDQRSEAARPARREVTPLKPSDEQQFQAWVTKNQITDLDHPDSHYDYRGYWKDVAGKGVDQRKQYDDGLHFPDTYKQHGHPTFSVESKYSSGPSDGGAWYGETFIPQRAVGPVRNQQSAPQIVAGLSAARDRLAQQTPTERLIAGMDPTLAGTRRSAAPTVTLASLSAAPTPRANVGTMLDLLQKNPEATQADLAELEAATQPRRPPVIRASTLSERLRDKYYDLFESAARQPIGRLADALGVSDLQGIANERGTGGKLMMATAVPPPGAGTLATVAKEAQAARALTGGFYSRVDEAAKFLPAKGVKAESLINTLKKASGGVSAEELELRGLAEFAASKRGQVVTPADLSAHLKANPAPFPTVKTLGGRNPVLYSPEGRPVPPFPATKFSKYQVPGGENYRETLLTLPTKQRLDARYAILSDARNPNSGVASRATTMSEAIAEAGGDATRVREIVGGTDPVNFRSSHFNDPNIVAHTRSNERTSPTGERGTFLEEVQSDWHQQGKEKGYAVKTTLADLDARINKEAEALMRQDDWPRAWIEELDINQRADLLGLYEDRLIAQERGVVTVGVPDAPFKENWPDLSLKQALIDEANRSPDPGFLGATGGKTQINRWGTERLAWEPIGKTGNSQRPAFRVSFEPQVGGNAAGGNMGEEALRRGLIQNSSTTVHSLEELTKLLGGSEVKAEKAWKRMMAKPEGGLYQPRAEGMTEFYDKQLPAKLEKIMKPFGGSVERGEILGAPLELQHTGRGRIVKYPQPEPAWLSRLTPEMKARILKEGLPLMGLSGVTLGSLLGAEKQQAR